MKVLAQFDEFMDFKGAKSLSRLGRLLRQG